MFFVVLTFSNNKAMAPEYMEAHNDWISTGFADGVFLSVGSLKPEGGGAILAAHESREKIELRVSADPFVVNDVVTAEIFEVDVKRTVPELELLKG